MSRSVYLCGSITPDPKCNSWRERAIQQLTESGIKVIDPCRGQDPSEFSKNGLEGIGAIYDNGGYVGRDLKDVLAADLVLCVWWGDPQRQSVGTWFELGWARANGKDVVFVDLTDDESSPRKHPFIYRNSTAVFLSLKNGLRYVEWYLTPCTS